MNCKNCSTQLRTANNYCPKCGAKVITEHITIKYLLHSIVLSMGWDRQFWMTLKDMIVKPEIVCTSYIHGTRKRYTNPFTLFAFSATLFVLVFTLNSDKIIELSKNASIIQMSSQYAEQQEGAANASVNAFQNKAFLDQLFEFQFTNYYYLSFLLLPFYTLLAFWVFGKRYNYAENLIVNTYMHGALNIVTTLLIVPSLLLDADLISQLGLVFIFFYYCYLYKRLYELNFWKLMLKILKFFGLLLLFSISLGIAGVIGARFL